MENRDKARELLDKPKEEKVFQNVNAPENCYPAILRLNGVTGLDRGWCQQKYGSIRRQNQTKLCLIKKIQTENPLLKGKIAGIRILFDRDDFTLVRLSLRFKTTRDRYLKLGRI